MNNVIEQRVKELLKNISQERGVAFNRLLETLFLERVLVRISKSKYKEQLILKGGMCLAQFLDLKRGTKDIDFLTGAINASLEKLSSIFQDIISIDCDDGVLFSDLNISQLPLGNKKSLGYRITMIGRLGQIRNKVSVDIGTGDLVKPELLEIELLRAKKIIFEDSVELLAYTPEYIFSEKLEAILYLGEINGRMKDYYDCFELINSQILNLPKLGDALRSTFEMRETPLELIPKEFENFLTGRWNSFLRKEKLDGPLIGNAICMINDFLKLNDLISS